MSTTFRLSSLLALVFALIASTFAASSAQAGDPPKPASIHGIVLTKVDGKIVPVRGAHVALKRGDKITQETLTDAKGQFAFDKVVPGPATILAGKAEVGRGIERVVLRPGEDQKVRIGLQK